MVTALGKGPRLHCRRRTKADDLAQPGIVTLAAPASSYLHGVIDQATSWRIDRILIVQGLGPFVRAVADGAAAHAAKRHLNTRTVDASALGDTNLAGTAVLVAGHFGHDLAVVQRLRQLPTAQTPALITAVAAGIQAFGQEAGSAAEGVLGPAQWWPTAHTPTIGPSGTTFAEQYQRRTGNAPSYVAAQAAAAGYLSGAAHCLGLTRKDVLQWQTSTLLGDFALNADWRQTGHRITTIEWRDGNMQHVPR